MHLSIAIYNLFQANSEIRDVLIKEKLYLFAHTYVAKSDSNLNFYCDSNSSQVSGLSAYLIATRQPIGIQICKKSFTL